MNRLHPPQESRTLPPNRYLDFSHTMRPPLMGISTKVVVSDITLSGSQLEQLVREYGSVAADLVKKIVAGVDAENISLAVMGKTARQVHPH